jgi:hypothetical protein
VLREELAAGARIAEIDGRELPRTFWRSHQVAAHSVGYYCFAERDSGGEVAGRLLISDPIPEPTQVEIRPVRWLVGLLRSLLAGRVETATAAGEAWGDMDYASCDDWLKRATREEPRKPGEGPSDYARRLAKVREKQVRRNPTGKAWLWDTIRARLAERQNSDQS